MASTETAFPFADQTNDEADWRQLIGALSESGVLDGLEVSAGSGMQVLVAPGSGFVEGFFYNLAGDPLPLAVDAAHSTQARKDYVILHADLTAKTVTAEVKAGTPTAGGGDLPTLTNDATNREIPLVVLTVPAGASNIVSGNIGSPLSIAPKRVIPYLSDATRPTPTADYAIGLNLTTKAVTFWNGSAWSGVAVNYSDLIGTPATFAPASHSLDSHSGTLSLAKGGTGATDAAGARTALGVVPASDISGFTGGTLDSARLPTVPISKGGTGQTDWEAARTALGIRVTSTPMTAGTPVNTIRLW